MKQTLKQLTKNTKFLFSNQPKPRSTQFSKNKFLKKRQEIKVNSSEYKQEENIKLKSQSTEKTEKNNEKQYENIDLNQISEQSMKKVPKNLVIKNLMNPKNKSHVIVLGVDSSDPIHCSYISDVLEQGKPDIVMTQLSPDQPYFIKTNSSYLLAWEKFVKGRFDYKFLINPQPKYLGDLIMDQTTIEHFIAGSVQNCQEEFDLTDKYVKTYNHIYQDFAYNPYFTPYMYFYNNQETKTPVVANDIPILKHRDYIARVMDLKELREIYTTLGQEYQKNNFNFDPQLYSPEHLLHPKLNYIVETLKHASHSNKRIVAIMDRHIADLLDEKWEQSDMNKLKNFDHFYNQIVTKKNQQPELTYLEYIEKLVILDLMFEPVLRKYFVINKTFPFIANDTIGYNSMHSNIFVIFEHYYRIYAGMLFDKISQEQMEKIQVQQSMQEDNLGYSDLSKGYTSNSAESLIGEEDDMKQYQGKVKNPFNPYSMFN